MLKYSLQKIFGFGPLFPPPLPDYLIDYIGNNSSLHEQVKLFFLVISFNYYCLTWARLPGLTKTSIWHRFQFNLKVYLLLLNTSILHIFRNNIEDHCYTQEMRNKSNTYYQIKKGEVSNLVILQGRIFLTFCYLFGLYKIMQVKTNI